MAYTEWQRQQWRIKKELDIAMANDQAKGLWDGLMTLAKFHWMCRSYGREKTKEIVIRFRKIQQRKEKERRKA